jgi:hypothetical protein
MRVPPTLLPELQQALREVWEAIDRASGSRNVDLHGRRFLNVGDATKTDEYITKAEAEALLGGATTAGESTRASTSTPSSTTPASPSYPFPADASGGVSLTPTLVWTGDGTSYDVYFGTTSSPTLVSAGLTDESYTPSTLAYNTVYYWKVVAHNAYTSTTGSIWSFTTLPAVVATPTAPASPSPANAATGVNILPRLSWSSTGATSYTVAFGNGLFNYVTALERPNRDAGTAPILAKDLYVGYFYSYSDKYGYAGSAPENFVWVEDLPSFEMAVASQLPIVISVGAPVTAPIAYSDTTGHESLIIGETTSGGTQSALVTAAANVVTARAGALSSVPIIGICDGFLPTSSVANVDWLALEAYVATAETAAAREAAIRNCLDTVTWGAGQKFVIIGHSFTSNASFAPSAAEMIAAQYIPANLAADYDDVVMLQYFAWTRPSGVIYDPAHPEYADHEPDWRPIHEAVFDGVRYRDYGQANYTMPDERDLLTPESRIGPAWYTCPDELADAWTTDVGAQEAPAVAVEGLTSASWSPPGLAPSQTYTWYVIALNTAGSATSATWAFTTTVPTTTTSSSPRSPSPAKGATGVSLTPILTWLADGAFTCDIYMGTTTTPGLVADYVPVTRYIPTPLAGSTTYYWKIVARNAAGTTTGPLWYFTTVGPAPADPTGPSPANGATGIGVDTDFSWTGSARAEWYTIGIGTTYPPTPTLYPSSANPTKLTTPSFNPPDNLLPSTRYYWYVQAWNAAGRSTGPVWSFTTAAATATKPTEPTGHTIDIVNYTFRTASNQALWRWQGCSYFGMLSDYLGSGIVSGVYDWARAAGINVFRVLTMKCGDPRRRGNGFPWAPLLPTDYSDAQLGAFLTAVETEGFYVQLVALADCDPYTDTGTDPAWAGLPTLIAKQAHLTRIAGIAASHTKTFVEACNEPYANGVTETDLASLTCTAGVWVTKGTGEAPYPPLPAWHYGTEHSPRTFDNDPCGKASWPRRAKNLYEYERGGYEGDHGDQNPPLNVPFIGNEPMGIDEQDNIDVSLNGTQRSADAQAHADYAGVAALLASGSTVHTQCLGLEGTLPPSGSDTERCVDAIRQVWADLPVSARSGTYTAGHLSSCPLVHDENTASKIYGTISGNEAWVVVVNKTTSYVEQVRAGWTVVGRYGYNGNLVKLRTV